MNRAFIGLGVAWTCLACSSSDAAPGGVGPFAGGGSGGAALPGDDGASATGPQDAEPEVPPPPPLTVASISPEDAASDVPLDVVIEIRFGSELDAATATEESIVVEGPDGPLEGELTVEGDVARFTPTSEIPLLTPIHVTLTAALASAEGGALAESIEAQFRSRDGAFRDPVPIDGGAAASLFLRGNDAGDLIATWTDLQVTPSVEAMVFDAELGTWSEAQRIEDDEQLAFSQPVAAIAASGNSIVAWQGGGWARYVDGWAAAIVGQDMVVPRIALGQDAALTVVNSADGSSYQFLPNDSEQWTEAEPLLDAGRVDVIDALGGGFIAVGTRDGALLAGQLSERGAEWSEFVSLAEIETVERLRVATEGDAAGVAWLDLRQGPETEDEDEALSRVAHPGARVLVDGTWSPPLEPPEGSSLPWISVATAGRALAVWTELDAVHASSYSSELGWAEPSELAETSQLAPTGGVDGRGNLLAAWPASEQISVRRRAAGEDEWQALPPLESQVTVALWSHVDRQGRVNLVWQNGSGTWWSRFE